MKSKEKVCLNDWVFGQYVWGMSLMPYTENKTNQSNKQTYTENT